MRSLDQKNLALQAKRYTLPYEETVIQFADHLVQQAQEQGASDVHIEPYEHTTRIRYRHDGLLYEIARLENPFAARLITRLKVLADLDISECRLPQDGRFRIETRHATHIEARLSSCPTLHGEKIVLRLLNNSKIPLSLAALGLSVEQQALFLKKLAQPQGLILVTGPTGSGKTITLYAALDQLNTQEKNILTVEDPVELQLEGINQVAIHPKTGLTFSTVLRALLRQDPDIIMVGEIRDRETAEIAIQAAQTGHQVLSTLHTNSAAETLARLLSMGIEPSLLFQALSLIIAQRLVRKLCSICKQNEAGVQGCQHCRQGYQGRTGLFECLVPSENLLHTAMLNSDPESILQAARAQGFVSLKESGLEKVRLGETSLAELKRVLLL